MADNFVALLEQRKPEILNVLPEYVNKDRWWAFMYALSQSKDLQRVAQNNPNSLINALKQLADWGLIPDGQEALIVPYGDTAQAQSMYKGDIKRVLEAKIAVHIYAELVREGDAFEATSGSTRDLKHIPVPFSTNPVIGCYAVAVLPNGLIDYEILNMQDMKAMEGAAQRNASRRGGNASSPAWQAFPGEMRKKSAIRRLCKRLVGDRGEEGDRYNRMVAAENNSFAEPINVTSRANDLDNPLPDNPPTDPRVPDVAMPDDHPIGKDSMDYADIEATAQLLRISEDEVNNLCEGEFNCSSPDTLYVSQLSGFMKRLQNIKGKAA